MKTIIILILICISLNAFAPATNTAVLVGNRAINPYEPVLRAISAVESKNGTYLFNSKENAVGWFGIRPIRLKDYNQRSGESITLDQCYDYETGRKIFMFFASKFNPDDYEGIAKDWNKSKTDKYWNLVKAHL